MYWQIYWLNLDDRIAKAACNGTRLFTSINFVQSMDFSNSNFLFSILYLCHNIFSFHFRIKNDIFFLEVDFFVNIDNIPYTKG